MTAPIALATSPASHDVPGSWERVSRAADSE